MYSECMVVMFWLVLKQRFTKSSEVFNFGVVCDCNTCGIVICILLKAHFLVSQLQFRNLLTQLGVPQLLEDVVSKDHKECYECYSNRCTQLQVAYNFYICRSVAKQLVYVVAAVKMVKFSTNEPSKASRHQFL